MFSRIAAKFDFNLSIAIAADFRAKNDSSRHHGVVVPPSRGVRCAVIGVGQSCSLTVCIDEIHVDTGEVENRPVRVRNIEGTGDV